MKQSTAVAKAKASANKPVDMHPQAPEPKAKAHVPIEDAISSKKDQQLIRDASEEYPSLSAEIKKLESRKSELSGILKKEMRTYGLESVQAGGFVVSYYVTNRSTIKADLLLANGVSVQTIQDCTETTASESVRVGKVQ